MTDRDLSRREILVGLVSAGLAPAVLADSVAAQSTTSSPCNWLGDQNAQGYELLELGSAGFVLEDVREISSPEVGTVRYHDGSGTGNTEGPAFRRSTDEWVSVVDGTVIS